MKKFLLFLMTLLSVCSSIQAKIYTVTSPDGVNEMNVSVSDKVQWSVNHRGREIIKPSIISMTLSNGQILGDSPRVKSAKVSKVDETITPLFYRKTEIKDAYNCLKVNFAGNYAIEFRAYDTGVAYRFSTAKKDSLTVVDEAVNYNFGADYKTFTPYSNDPREGERYCVSFESYYDEASLSQLYVDSLIITPMLVDMGDGCKVALMDAGQEDYPGMFMKLNPSKNGITGEFAPCPLAFVKSGANILPTKRADYLAKTSGTRTFPWRVAVISDKDADLANNDLAYCLAPECRLDDVSWIKAGKAAWDWWNGQNVVGVDFPGGCNMETYKHYIDFAAENNLEYFVIDAGWCAGPSLLKSKMDMAELVSYGKGKNVNLILWASCSQIMGEYEAAFRYYSSIGISGFKLDFFDRDDQVMMNQLYTLAACAAKYHLLLDLHGMKAFGINRPYPNVLSYEGVKGLENYKWADVVDELPVIDASRYDVTAPFVRLLSGAMDYTPGAMDNAMPERFRSIDSNPMSEGSRVHQMAMYTIFETPLQMLSDAPHKYRRNQECTDFIAKVPTVFDETVVLDGKVGEYIIMAKKAKGVWYVAGLTNRTGRSVEIDFSFLGSGSYHADVFSDGVNVSRCGEDYRRHQQVIKAGDKLKVQLGPSGGWTAILTAQ